MLQCEFAELKVCWWGCCNDYYIYSRVFDHLFCAAVAFDSWVVFFGVIFRLRVSLDDREKVQIWSYRDQWDVEDYAKLLE